MRQPIAICKRHGVTRTFPLQNPCAAKLDVSALAKSLSQNVKIRALCSPIKENIKNVLKAFSIEVPLYAVVVGAYAFFVLHFLGSWLFQLFRQERKLYAVMALLLIACQGFILEIVSRALLGLVNGKKEK